MNNKEPNFTCSVCGKEIHLPPSLLKNRRYCSRECQMKDGYYLGENNPHWKGGLAKCICKNCGKEFYIKQSHKKKGEGVYCSYKCEYEARRGISLPQFQKRVIKHCAVCGKEISVKASHKDYEGTCCSRECMAIYYSDHLKGDNNPHWKGGKIELICRNCGKKYYRAPSTADKSHFCSSSCCASWRIKNEGNVNTKRNYRIGKRGDLGGLFVRSRWEANYARYLNWLISMGEIKSWEYEPDEFVFPVKRGNIRYLPDFKIINNDGSIEYHEVKGYMDNDSRVKLKRMEKYYPDIKLILIDKDVYKSIEKTMSRIIVNWEGRRS